MAAKTTKTCNYPIGVGGAPRTCDKPARFLTDPSPYWFYDRWPEGYVCGIHKNALARDRGMDGKGEYSFTPLT